MVFLCSGSVNVGRHCCLAYIFSLSKLKTIFIILLTVILGILFIPVFHSYALEYVDKFVKIDPARTHTRQFRHGTSVYRRRYPEVIIIGARKGGTRALLEFINVHTDIVVSAHETHYFDWFHEQGDKWYLKQMPKSYPDQIIIEKSPNYFLNSKAPKRIHEFNPRIKLILVLRNPLDRAISDYVQLQGNKKELKSTNSFEKLVINQKTGEVNKSYIAIRHSLYSEYMDNWLDYFDLSQMLFLDGENIRYRPWEELHSVEKFLGVSHELQKSNFYYNSSKGFFCINLNERDSDSGEMKKCLSESKGRPHPEVNPKVRRKLADFFEPYNEILFKMIDRRYDW